MTLDPLINLAVVMTALSVMTERFTNVLKLRHPTLRVRTRDAKDGLARESGIQLRAILVGIAVAVLVKADMFTLLAHLPEGPWTHLGWVHVTGGRWFLSQATMSTGAIVYTLAGCVLTGVATGFGSKFWHDILGTLFEIRSMARERFSLLGTRGLGSGGGPNE